MLKKRSVKKLVISQRRKVTPLAMAPADAAFWVNNGPSLRHLLDLNQFLAIITEEQFRYHTERDGNDFAKWVEAVLGDRMCARALRASKTAVAARQATARALKRYDV